LRTILTDEEIIDSWHINASAWIKAIKNEEIESRKIITNDAILNTIINHKPNKVLDIGCGEGWLARVLANKNINVFGIDAIPTLIDYANQLGGEKFDVCLYENLSEYKFHGQFDYTDSPSCDSKY
jgi:2-polyprenyl-3-methyl-5-hydroxy-6-metoxy-1,4-benzoquinol methylase